MVVNVVSFLKDCIRAGVFFFLAVYIFAGVKDLNYHSTGTEEIKI